MSLEQALADNTAAMKALTAALSKGAGGGKADAAIEKEATRAAAAGAGKPALTAEKFAAAWTDWLAAADGDDDADDRKAKIKATSKHYNLKKISEAPKEKWAELMAVLKQFKDGETPDFMDDSGDTSGI